MQTSGHGEEANEEKLREIMGKKKKKRKKKDFKKGQLGRLIMTPKSGNFVQEKNESE